VTNELLLLVREFGFTLPEIKHLLMNGFKSAFLGHKSKVEMLKKITRELESY
jgi:hypothetical protein